MDEALTRIVRNKIYLEDSIDTKLLLENTKRIASFSKLPWKRIRHLHILGTREALMSNPLPDNTLKPGWYLGGNSTWVLALCLPKHEIMEQTLANCGDQLELLDIRFTPLDRLALSHLPNLKTLLLPNNPSLKEIHGLKELVNLRKLNLDSTAFCQTLDLQGMKSLEELRISDCSISRIVLNSTFPQLKILYTSHSSIYNFDFLQHCSGLCRLSLRYSSAVRLPQLSHLTQLEYLDLEHSKIQELPSLKDLKNLHTLNLDSTPIALPADFSFPPHLRNLDLSGTEILQLPDSIGDLKELDKLNLVSMKLKTLPGWMADTHLHIGMDSRFGINLAQTTIVDCPDTSIFKQSQKLIRQWLAHRKEASPRKQEPSAVTDPSPRIAAEKADPPENELKIIFLGDGGAGKTYTIARLKEGMNPKSYKDDSTPGIAISDDIYTINGRRIRVNFWDFGGQDILWSMHRMFLTSRTLYVVMLNVREGTQDERARHWLRNIQSFAADSPVMLVLNQMDHNRNASVNESELKARFPNLKDVVKISATIDPEESFQNEFVSKLRNRIDSIETVDYSFIPQWHRLKNQLRNLNDDYIQAEQYRALCSDCGIDDEDIRRDLLTWFNQLGVSFCYSDDARLEHYVILNPEWITNAIYMILFNMDKVTNGMVSHKDLFDLLGNESKEIKRILPDITYKPHEVEYVLHVVRRFRLSYRVNDNTEFIPMLCRNNTPPIATEYEQDPDALEFRMEYDYLPANVLHRLMVELRADLDTDNVWYTGARFAEETTGLSAVVKAEGNSLRIFVRRSDTTCPPRDYLDSIRKSIHRISKEMEAVIEDEQIAYKTDCQGGSVEYFNYQMLDGSLKKGLTSCYSPRRDSIMSIPKILMQSTRQVKSEQEQLTWDIMRICRMMQDNSHYWNVIEDIRTTYMRDGLRLLHYHVYDQTRAGSSELGPNAGELDLKIQRELNTDWTILEALNLKGWGQTYIDYWNRHLNKLLDNYNSPGLSFLFHVSYVSCAKNNFKKFFNTYLQHMQTYSPNQFSVESWEELPVTPTGYDPSHFLRAARCVYDCGGAKTTVYHIFVHFGKLPAKSKPKPATDPGE